MSMTVMKVIPVSREYFRVIEGVTLRRATGDPVMKCAACLKILDLLPGESKGSGVVRRVRQLARFAAAAYVDVRIAEATVADIADDEYRQLGDAVAELRSVAAVDLLLDGMVLQEDGTARCLDLGGELRRWMLGLSNILGLEYNVYRNMLRASVSGTTVADAVARATRARGSRWSTATRTEGGSPMAGREPCFARGDRVVIGVVDREGAALEAEGTVEIIDYRGAERELFKGCSWSYDVLVPEHPYFDGRPCLCKHISECDVRPAGGDAAGEAGE